MFARSVDKYCAILDLISCYTKEAHNSLLQMKSKEATLLRKAGMLCYPFSSLTYLCSGEHALLKARQKSVVLILHPGDTHRDALIKDIFLSLS